MKMVADEKTLQVRLEFTDCKEFDNVRGSIRSLFWNELYPPVPKQAQAVGAGEVNPFGGPQ